MKQIKIQRTTKLGMISDTAFLLTILFVGLLHLYRWLTGGVPIFSTKEFLFLNAGTLIYIAMSLRETLNSPLSIVTKELHDRHPETTKYSDDVVIQLPVTSDGPGSEYHPKHDHRA
jgi:hypothetical protein